MVAVFAVQHLVDPAGILHVLSRCLGDSCILISDCLILLLYIFLLISTYWLFEMKELPL